MTVEKLRKDYIHACNNYVKKFCEKQGMEFEGWVADIVGDIAMCNDFFFNLRDIVWDVNSNQDKGDIVDWYYETLERPKEALNYYNWTKKK